VMGATGTGRSTYFIHLLTKDAKIIVGHGTRSETREIATGNYFDVKTGSSVTLLDTPGFDDSNGKTDVDILEETVEFLQAGDGRKANGIIYLHRITNNRLGGTEKRNVEMLQKLCGQDRLSNVRLVTTFWEEIPGSKGIQREKDLARDEAVKPLIDAGALLVRHSGEQDLESARAIMSQLIPKEPVKLKVQEELDAKIPLIMTGAGAALNDHLDDKMKKIQDKMDALMKKFDAEADERKREETAKRLMEEDEKKAR
ncbi:hypothetical protein B0H19DRAFT_855939, partial [Mycena capillaripes]